jgi:hypothetical protein
MNAPIFKPSSTPFQSFEEECYFTDHSSINLVHVHAHYVIASEIAALTAGEDFHTNKKKPWADCSIR